MDLFIKGIPAFVENKITRMLTTETPSTAQLLRRPFQPRKPYPRKRSRSMDSIKGFRAVRGQYLRVPINLSSRG